jgi:hypothetical protein
LPSSRKSLRLTFATNAADVWTALKNGSAPPKPIHLPERQALIVWGQDFMARFRPLSTEEAMMWDEAAKGVRFGVLCEMVGPSLARTAPSFAPRLISRVGSTRGC